MAIRQTYPVQVRLSAAGAGEALFVARGDVLVEHVRIRVSTAVLMPTAILYLNGAEFEGSYTGANDQTDTKHLMIAGDELKCVWTGGDANATATMYVRGTEYPAGQGMKAVSG